MFLRGGGGYQTNIQRSAVTSKNGDVKRTSCIMCVRVVWNTISHSWHAKKKLEEQVNEQVNQKNFSVKKVIGGM